MKAFLPIYLTGVLAVSALAQEPKPEAPPAGAAEKIQAALPEAAFAKPKQARKLLVFSRTNGFRHASIATGKLAFTELGKKSGAYEAIVSDDLANFDEANIKKFDGIMFLSTTMNPFSPRKEELATMSEDDKRAATEVEMKRRDNLMAFVKSGKGFIGIHAATDTFYDFPEYGKMMNGYFDGHPWGSGTMVSIKVEPGQEKHPLAVMFEGQNMDFKEEIYQLKDPYDSKKVHMLLRLDPEKSDMNVKGLKREDKDWGVAWVRHWEKGRVFYCSLGHNNEMYWNPKILKHYLSGIQWALGDYEVDVTK
jgi:type 1 glutamine amidotransferase